MSAEPTKEVSGTPLPLLSRDTVRITENGVELYSNMGIPGDGMPGAEKKRIVAANSWRSDSLNIGQRLTTRANRRRLSTSSGRRWTRTVRVSASYFHENADPPRHWPSRARDPSEGRNGLRRPAKTGSKASWKPMPWFESPRLRTMNFAASCCGHRPKRFSLRSAHLRADEPSGLIDCRTRLPFFDPSGIGIGFVVLGTRPQGRSSELARSSTRWRFDFGSTSSNSPVRIHRGRDSPRELDSHRNHEYQTPRPARERTPLV